MATYKSTVARALGLNHTAGADPRLITPGTEFEAKPEEIPALLLQVGDVVLVKADKEPEPVEPEPKAKPVEAPKAAKKDADK